MHFTQRDVDARGVLPHDETDTSLFRLTAPKLGRRDLMRSGVALAAGVAMLRPHALLAGPLAPSVRSLPLANIHTGERQTVEYWQRGRYLPDGLRAINHLMRDYRNNEMHQIDPTLLDLSYLIHNTLQSRQPFVVISGYRSPETNAMLREETCGVAQRSFHLQGKAMDIRLPGVDTRVLHTIARRIYKGGVGYYPESDFVHIDVGPPRTW